MGRKKQLGVALDDQVRLLLENVARQSDRSIADEIRNRIERTIELDTLPPLADAASKSGRSVQDEVKQRLRRSFGEENFDRATRKLGFAIMELAHGIQENSGCADRAPAARRQPVPRAVRHRRRLQARAGAAGGGGGGPGGSPTRTSTWWRSPRWPTSCRCVGENRAPRARGAARARAHPQARAARADGGRARRSGRARRERDRLPARPADQRRRAPAPRRRRARAAADRGSGARHARSPPSSTP